MASIWNKNQQVQPRPQQPNIAQQPNVGGVSPTTDPVNRFAQNPGGSTTQTQSPQQQSTGGGFAGYGAGGVSQTASRTGYGLGGNYNPGLSGMRHARAQPIAPTQTPAQAAPTPAVPQQTAPQQQAAPVQAAPVQYNFGQGSMTGGQGYDNYGDFADAVGHEGVAKGGLNREQYRDAWMGSGISNPQQMDAFLAANGGQRLNDSGVVRTPFGEVLDMGINYKTGRGQPGWTNIGMNG